MYNSIIVHYYFALVPDVPDSLGQYLMLPTTDYAQQTITFNAIDNETITELMRIVCYDQPIYDDDCLEEDEWLGLTLGVDDATVSTVVRPMYDQAAILIRDNDSKLQHNNTILTYLLKEYRTVIL